MRLKVPIMNKSKRNLFIAMALFGTIGLFRRFIDLPSGVLALARAVVGGLFLAVPMLAKKQRIWDENVKKNLLLLTLSGFALGLNWMLLFEAYEHTTIATATILYYLAPIIVILLSPIFFREKLTAGKLICAGIALIGAVLVSDVLLTGFTLSGWEDLLFGLGAACFYACVMILNKKIQGIAPLTRTVYQLAASALVLLPYCLLREEISISAIDAADVVMTVIVGIVHTGIAYGLYFHSVSHLPAQNTAMLSYLDPVIAIILSFAVMGESISVWALLGGVLIIGAAIVLENADRLTIANKKKM